MSLITDYYKIDEKSLREREAAPPDQKKKTSLVSTYYPTKERPLPPKKKTFTERVKEGVGSIRQKISDFDFGKAVSGTQRFLFDRGPDPLSQFATGTAKFGARTAIEAFNLGSSTADFATNFFKNTVKREIESKTTTAKLLRVPGAQQIGTNLANKWQNFYAPTTNLTGSVKEFTESLREIPFIQPSKEWSKAPNSEKFSTRLPETILNIGPGVVASLGAFAVNPIVGLSASVGSTADEVKTIAMENGMNEDRAEMVGLGTGVLVGWLDKIVPDEIFSPQQKKQFIGGIAKRVIKIGTKEAATEMTQETVQLAVESTIREDLGMDEAQTRIAMSGLGGFLGGAGASTTVNFVNSVQAGDIGVEDVAPAPAPAPIDILAGEPAQVEPVTRGVVRRTVTEVDGKKVFKKEIVQVPVEKKPVSVKKKVTGVKPDQKVIKKTDVVVKPGEKIVRKTEIESVTEKKIKAIKDVKTAKSVLKNIRVELESSVAEAKGIAVIAEEQRAGLDTTNVAKLKRIVSLNKKFREGDIETIRVSKSGDLLNSVIENVQEVHPEMSEQETFDFAMELPTKADEKGRTPTIVALEKKEKILRKHLDQLKEKQKELLVKEGSELDIEFQKVLAIQEELTEIVKVEPSQLPVGEGKIKVSRLEARIKGKLGTLSEAEIEELGLSTFKQVNKKENIAKASAYVAVNPDEALRVIKGEIDPPKGVLVNSVFVALHELGATDTDVAIKVASLGATRMGQEISVLSEILQDSPVAMMEGVVRTRIKAFEKRTGKKVSDKIRSEKKKIDADLKVPNARQWDSFLKEVLC